MFSKNTPIHNSLFIIPIIAGLILGNFAAPVYAGNNKEIRGIRKVLIVPEGQTEWGVEMSKEMGVGEVADGIPPALKDKVTENMLPYVYEEIVYEEEGIPEETQKAIEKLGADIAEYYPVFDENIEAGDLVSISDKKELILATSTDYLIEKSSRAYDSKLLGVISSQSAIIIGKGDSGAKPEQILRPVALVGRVPVKVNLQNGPIEIGDYLTSSDVPGVAMSACGRSPVGGKATICKAGKVIGMALENFDESGITNHELGIGKIVVFMNVGWFDGSSIASTTDVMLSSGFFEKLKSIVSIVVDTITGLPKMIVNGILEVKNDIVTHGVLKTIVKVAKTVVQGRTIVVDNAATAENSQLEVAAEDAESLSFVTYSIMSPRKEIMVSGSGKLLMASSSAEARIVFHPYFSSVLSEAHPVRVVVTPTSYINGNLYVAEKSIYGFTIKEINSQDAGAEFDWIVTARLTDPDLAQEVLNQISGDPISQILTENQEIGSPNIENGANRPCSTEVGACQIGVQIYQDGIWGECIGAIFPTEELCDGVDNNCDGTIDEGVCGIATSTEPLVEPATTSTDEIATTTPQ